MGCVVGGVVTLDCLPGIIGSLLFWLLTFAGSAALLFVIIGGFKFLTSGGDKEKVEGARKTLTWAIVGLIVILSSFLIVITVGQVTGITCISTFPFDFSNCGLKRTNNAIQCPGQAPNLNCGKNPRVYVQCDHNDGVWKCMHD